MPELDAKASAYYQSLIGILQWVVELGHVDICLGVSMMSTHMTLPRKGHLDQVLQIFGYLKKYHKTELVYDPSEPEIELPQFERRDWMASEFGHVVGKEETPNDMPEPRGMGLSYGRKLMWSAPISWWSKKQTSVESSSFGSEFIPMKQSCEYLHGLRYKLRMMGIPCEHSSYIYGDNQLESQHNNTRLCIEKEVSEYCLSCRP